MQFKAEKLPELQFKMLGSRQKTSLDRIYLPRNRVQAVLHESKVQEDNKEKYE